MKTICERRQNLQRKVIRWGLLIFAGLVIAAPPASARILSTKPTPAESWDPLLPLVIGGGFEFQTDKNQTEYDFPLLIEYSFTEQLKLTIEPNVVLIEPERKHPRPSLGFDNELHSADGYGDTETSLSYEFLSERRYRPALTLEGIIRWPTATNPDIGDEDIDYSLGLIASKDFVYVNTDLGVRFTSIGDSEEHDAVEVTLAGELPLNHFVSLVGESVTTIETGHGGRPDTEGTVGILWHVTKRLTLELGGTLSSDGTWQLITAWEWSFAGED